MLKFPYVSVILRVLYTNESNYNGLGKLKVVQICTDIDELSQKYIQKTTVVLDLFNEMSKTHQVITGLITKLTKIFNIFLLNTKASGHL